MADQLVVSGALRPPIGGLGQWRHRRDCTGEHAPGGPAILPDAVRILLHLPYPGYLRLYGSTVALLASRGHRVLISYDSAKQRSDAAVAFESLAGVELVSPVPRRSGDLLALAGEVRVGADYMRYLDRRFEGSPWLRERMEKFLPDSLRFMTSVPVGDSAQIAAVLRHLRAVERSIPSDPAIERFLAELGPDRMMVSPVLARGPSGVHQRDSVKSARAVGIPVAVGVASWDHLTSKGVIGELPDVLLVWNEAQRSEAVELHGVPAERIEITGAQTFDHWFDRRPAQDRARFAADVGLDPARPYLLFVGSSPNIAPVEVERMVVSRWIDALRASADADLNGIGVLIRPHPGNVAGWADFRPSQPNVAVSPRERPEIVMSRSEEDHYFDSIHHSAAVVGVNTSAMVESAIVGRAVHTFLAPEFESTQVGTLHFRLLTEEGGGLLRVAADLDEHFAQLHEVLRDPTTWRAELERFVREFVRPCGLDRPATEVLADAIERVQRRD